MRVWFSGRIRPFQGWGESSILSTRTKPKKNLFFKVLFWFLVRGGEKYLRTFRGESNSGACRAKRDSELSISTLIKKAETKEICPAILCKF